MTDVNGSGADASGNRTVVDANADKGSNGGGADWLAGLETDNRSIVEAKQWKSPNDAVKSYRELESHASKALTVPGENAAAEDWDKFYERLGRPKAPTDYTLNVDRTKLPAEFPYDDTLAVNFRNWAHANGLNAKQAQGLHDSFVGSLAEQFTGQVGKINTEQEAAHRELTSKWGAPDSDGYKKNVELMSRAAMQLDIKDGLVAAKMMTPDGGIRNAKLAFALERVGRELFAEDSFGSGGGGVVNNPWSAKSFNLTEQGKLVRSDPDKARALIRAAGEDPAKYQL